MKVASLELCRTLFELSGWDATDDELGDYDINAGIYPQYTLGYLIRRLPRIINGINSKQRQGNFNFYASRGNTTWIASYADIDGSVIRRLKKDAETQNPRNFWWVQANAQSPEDAACKLAIELFKQGVLK